MLNMRPFELRRADSESSELALLDGGLLTLAPIDKFSLKPSPMWQKCDVILFLDKVSFGVSGINIFRC